MFAVNGILFNHESPRRGYTQFTCFTSAKVQILTQSTPQRDLCHAQDHARCCCRQMRPAGAAVAAAVCVRILLSACPHATRCVLILLCMCPQTTMFVSSYCCMCNLDATRDWATLPMSPDTSHHTTTSVLILVCMCPHATRTACVWATFMRRVTGATRATTCSACG